MSDSKIQCISLRGKKSVNYEYARLWNCLKSRHPAYYFFILTTFANISFFLLRKANKRKRKKLMRIMMESSQTLEHCQNTENTF